MGQVIEINQKLIFTLEEAAILLPVVRRITFATHQGVQKLNTQLAYTKDKDKRTSIEESIRNIFQSWHEKMHKLGCEPKGMWLVDFDNGEGYYCWHYPESSINFAHGYLEGFRGRTRIH